MPARTLMIQGTGSHVGKSVLTAAFCRWFARRGVKVAPFKAQNMSNNSFATPDGFEIGRAQAVQAAACRLAPRADFNPILIKPSSELDAQLVVDGRVAGTLRAGEFGRLRSERWPAVEAAFERLSKEFELIVIEGAGSPAEVNLRDYDIVNMRMAAHARAPVILVGDIDRGGVLAAIVGTVSLLTADERAHLKGFLVNKFRGDRALLTPGLEIVTERTGLPCLGVVPFWRGLDVPEEDAVTWPSPLAGAGRVRGEQLTIGVVDLPCISNFTDFDALAGEPDVELVRITSAASAPPLDALIFPGSKNTPQALGFVRERGIDGLARDVAAKGMVVGICAGYQLLGRRLLDPDAIESSEPEIGGLGLLDVETCFEAAKRTVQVSGIHRESGCRIAGYEIHMGRTTCGPAVQPLFLLDAANDVSRPEGAVSRDGRIWGTSVHGLFDRPEFRRYILNALRRARGWSPRTVTASADLDASLNAWADVVAAHVDMAVLEAIVNAGVPR